LVAGRANCFCFNPYRVRFDLSDDEKRSFADEFSRELARARSAD